MIARFKFYKNFWTFQILFCLFCMDVVASSQGTQIKILSRSEVNQETIRLGAISEIQSHTWEETKKIGDISIGPAPIFGRIRNIRKIDIIEKLRQNRIDLSNLQIESPEEIKVIRSFVKISKEEIEKNVLSEIKRVGLWDDEYIKIKKVQVGNGVTLPKGSITYQIELSQKYNSKGPVLLPVTIKVGEHFEKEITATVYREIFADVVVTKNSLRRYQTISKNDIHLKKMDMSKISSNIILDCNEVLGKRTKRAIYPKTALRADLVEWPPIIRRNDIVTIIAEIGNLRVTTVGEAQERGRKGERIKVINTDSGEKIYARVVDIKTVRIDF